MRDRRLGRSWAIGDHCSIAAGVHVYSHDTIDWALSGGRAAYRRQPTRIGDDCYIGPHAVITAGVQIGSRCLVGALSMVKSDLPDGSVAVGCPARIIGPRRDRRGRPGRHPLFQERAGQRRRRGAGDARMKRLPITAPQFDDAELAALRACLESKMGHPGAHDQAVRGTVRRAWHQVPHALATTSCTAALHLATTALGLGPGDEVVVPAFTWVTSAHSAEYVGARTIFADVDLRTFNLDPKGPGSGNHAANQKPSWSCICFGLSACLDEILDIARRHRA